MRQHVQIQNDVPLVSIVTVCRNLIEAQRVEMFRQCVASVKAQTYPKIQHLIVDGGSTDGTVDVIKSCNVEYISEPDRSIYDAMNKGILLAKGEYVLFLNSDDFFHHPEGILRSVEALKKSKADYSYACGTVMWNEDENTRHLWKSRFFRVLWRMPFCHQTMLCKRDVLVREGMFDLHFRSAADYDLIIRLFLKGYKNVKVNQVFVTFRTGGESFQNLALSQKEQVDAFEKNYSPYVVKKREAWECYLHNPCLPIELLPTLALHQGLDGIRALAVYGRYWRKKLIRLNIGRRGIRIRLFGRDWVNTR